MNEKIYDINYRKLVTWLVPVPLRGVVMLSWLMALVSPFIDLYNNLIRFRDAVLYRLTITPQVVYLEKMLNDRFDIIERRIVIKDGQEFLPLFLFKKAEVKPIFFYRKSETTKPKTHLLTKGEVGAFTWDFVVFVPVLVPFDINEMIALINAYKLADKVYKIQII